MRISPWLGLLALTLACGTSRSGVPVPDEAPDIDSLSADCQEALDEQPQDNFCIARCAACENLDNLQRCRTRCLLAEVDGSAEDLDAATSCWSSAQDCTPETEEMCGGLADLLDLDNVIAECAQDIERIRQ
jgi:hypothetical protein